MFLKRYKIFFALFSIIFIIPITVMGSPENLRIDMLENKIPVVIFLMTPFSNGVRLDSYVQETPLHPELDEKLSSYLKQKVLKVDYSFAQQLKTVLMQHQVPVTLDVNKHYKDEIEILKSFSSPAPKKQWVLVIYSDTSVLGPGTSKGPILGLGPDQLMKPNAMTMIRITLIDPFHHERWIVEAKGFFKSEGSWYQPPYYPNVNHAIEESIQFAKRGALSAVLYGKNKNQCYDHIDNSTSDEVYTSPLLFNMKMKRLRIDSRNYNLTCIFE
jgi:hypothetical protein